jgi:hypothetical protein
VEADPATAGSYASQTYKLDAALKLAAVAANAGLSETETCKQRVALLRIELILQTLAALQANAVLFKTQINKPIAEQLAEVLAANAVLSASPICKRCAAQRRGVAQANVDLYGIAICSRLVGRWLNNIEEPFLNSVCMDYVLITG